MLRQLGNRPWQSCFPKKMQRNDLNKKCNFSILIILHYAEFPIFGLKKWAKKSLLPTCSNIQKSRKKLRMGTHTISNSSTFRGWLESMGVDDMIFDPCGCIFGETEPAPVPIPGAPFNRQMSQRRSTHSSNPSNRASQRHSVWKLLKMSHLNFCDFGISHQFLSY